MKGETKTKWIKRREKEVRTGKKGVLMNGDIIISELLMNEKQPLIADKKT